MRHECGIRIGLGMELRSPRVSKVIVVFYQLVALPFKFLTCFSFHAELSFVPCPVLLELFQHFFEFSSTISESLGSQLHGCVFTEFSCTLASSTTAQGIRILSISLVQFPQTQCVCLSPFHPFHSVLQVHSLFPFILPFVCWSFGQIQIHLSGISFLYFLLLNVIPSSICPSIIWIIPLRFAWSFWNSQDWVNINSVPRADQVSLVLLGYVSSILCEERF